MRLKKHDSLPGNMIYQQGSDMAHFYIVQKGTCAFISPRLNASIFAVVDGRKKEALKYFGLEDTVINHAMLIQDIHNNDMDKSMLDQRANPSIMSKRFFTVQCISYLECFTLDFEDMDAMKEAFEGSFRILMKYQLKQTVRVLNSLL